MFCCCWKKTDEKSELKCVAHRLNKSNRNSPIYTILEICLLQIYKLEETPKTAPKTVNHVKYMMEKQYNYNKRINILKIPRHHFYFYTYGLYL